MATAKVLSAGLSSLAICLSLTLQAAQDPPTTQPATQPAPTSRTPRQAEVIEQLLRQTQRVRTPIEAVGQAGGAAATEADNSLLLEGTTLTDLPGRLLKSGERWVFQFRPGVVPGGGPESMLILENGFLQLMEDEARHGRRDFVISAEVTRYRGANYLYLLKVNRPVDSQNLAP